MNPDKLRWAVFARGRAPRRGTATRQRATEIFLATGRRPRLGGRGVIAGRGI